MREFEVPESKPESSFGLGLNSTASKISAAHFAEA
jgi:hypothetical protein